MIYDNSEVVHLLLGHSVDNARFAFFAYAKFPYKMANDVMLSSSTTLKFVAKDEKNINWFTVVQKRYSPKV